MKHFHWKLSGFLARIKHPEERIIKIKSLCNNNVNHFALCGWITKNDGAYGILYHPKSEKYYFGTFYGLIDDVSQLEIKEINIIPLSIKENLKHIGAEFIKK